MIRFNAKASVAFIYLLLRILSIELLSGYLYEKRRRITVGLLGNMALRKAWADFLVEEQIISAQVGSIITEVMALIHKYMTY